MKVCLINPPITKQKKNEIKNSASIPYAQNLQHPGVATIASYLASFSYEIEVIECDGQGIGVNETVRAVFVGIESFVERQLLFFNKKVTPQENEKALKLLNNNGIQYNIGMILYDPLATMEEIDVNINMLIQLEYFNNIFETSAAISLLSPLRPVSGSVFEDYLLKNGIYSTDKEYGYEFKDNRVNEYYTFICDRWLPRIEAVRKKYINGEMTDSDFIAWKKVVEYDLCFLQESINAFINNKCYL